VRCEKALRKVKDNWQEGTQKVRGESERERYERTTEIKARLRGFDYAASLDDPSFPLTSCRSLLTP
jgi:hypothetical protein